MHQGNGPIALVGSGEYLSVMDGTDRRLLDQIGGAPGAHVALLPTASGKEGNRPNEWNDLGLAHFRALGVADIRPIHIIDAQSALDPTQVDLLRGATFYYFSGGDPHHLTTSLQGSPSWEVIHEAFTRGAVLAGCSAGAMAFGGLVVRPSFSMAIGRVQTIPGLGIVPQAIVLPHFDRMRRYPGMGLGRIRSSIPDEMIALGIDEDTALVRLTEGEPWQVIGRQTVTISRAGQSEQVLKVGETVTL